MIRVTVFVATLAFFLVFVDCSTYDVTIYTDDELFSGTNADVQIRLFGEAGVSGLVKLPYKKEYFESDSVDTFSIKTLDLGTIKKIQIGHEDNAKLGSSWKVRKVVVQEKGSPVTSEFKIYRWLDDKTDMKNYVEVEAKQTTECGNTIQPRVVNGKTSAKGQWPWQVQMSSPLSGNEHFCGGTLIHPQYVLTAAHCVEPFMKAIFAIKIKMGEHNIGKYETEEQSFRAAEVTVHPDWSNRRLNNDVALIKLSRPAILNSNVKLACLPKQEETLKDGQQCYISGWGLLYGQGPIPRVLQHAVLPTVPRKECANKMNVWFGLLISVNDNMICGGGNYKGGCQGDSGGPFVCQNKDNKFVIQGAVSWGKANCMTKDSYTVFARVARYVNWIESTMYSKYISKSQL